MTQEEINALVSWIGEQRPRVKICVYVDIPDTEDGPYECAHGKRMSWEKARRALGLPQ